MGRAILLEVAGVGKKVKVRVRILWQLFQSASRGRRYPGEQPQGGRETASSSQLRVSGLLGGRGQGTKGESLLMFLETPDVSWRVVREQRRKHRGKQEGRNSANSCVTLGRSLALSG